MGRVGGGVEDREIGGPIVRIFDAVKYEQMAEIRDHAGAVHAVSFSHDSRRLVTVAAEDGTLRVVKAPGGDLLTTIGKQGDSAFNCVVHSPDGDLVIVGSGDGTVAAGIQLRWPSNSSEQKAHGAAVTCSEIHTPTALGWSAASADRSLKHLRPRRAGRGPQTLHPEVPARRHELQSGWQAARARHSIRRFWIQNRKR